jgi:type IV secretory pathway VirB2 component (pilin)
VSRSLISATQGRIGIGPAQNSSFQTAPMARILDLYCALLKGVIALCLAVMVVLVFGNVVLRYGFNSGITISESCRAGYWCG